MSKIVVNTEQLRKQARDIQKASDDLRAVSGQLSVLINSVNHDAYQGQLTQKIREILGGVENRAGQLAGNLSELQKELNRRAALFDEANRQTLQCIVPLTRISNFTIYQTTGDLRYPPRSIEGSFPQPQPKEGTKPSTQGDEITHFNNYYSNWIKTGGFGVYLKTDKTPDGVLHNGLDLKPNGEDWSIYPIGPGKIVDARWNNDGLGYRVKIEHQLSDGTFIESTYGHLANQPSVKVGDWIAEDVVLGQMGNSGLGKEGTKGAHLHLTINEKDQKDLWQFHYHKGNPQGLTDTGLTHEQQMRGAWIDPTPYINGQKDFDFVTIPGAE